MTEVMLFVCQGADGVEYLLIPVDNGTLTDFLEKNHAEWNPENLSAVHRSVNVFIWTALNRSGKELADIAS